jgi:hypothetical protein
MKNITLGKLIGILAFINVIFMQYLHIILPIMFRVEIEYSFWFGLVFSVREL